MVSSSGLLPGAEPFFVKRGKIGVLILHGYTSTPQEMRFLRERLVKSNITVSCPLLKGHGTKVSDLRDVKPEDWYAQVRSEYTLLRKSCNKVAILGSSFGANLAAVLAPELKPDAVLLLGMPYNSWAESVLRAFIWPLTFWYQFFHHDEMPKKYDKKDLVNVEGKVHYLSYCASNLRQVARVVADSRRGVPNLKMPVLVMQSTKDRYLPNNNARVLFRDVPAGIKQLVFIPDAYHVLTMSKVNKELALEAVDGFLKKVL